MTGGTWMETGPRALLSRCDPRLKLAWVFAVSLLSLVVDSRAALVVLFAATVGVAALLAVGRRSWIAIVALLATVAWGTMLSQAMFYPVEPRTRLATLLPAAEFGRFAFPGIHLYAEGASYGLLQSLRLLAVLLAGLTVCLSTSPQRLLAALVAVRVPVALSFMSVAALRFLPTVAEQWSTVRASCRLRGYRLQRWRLALLDPAAWRMEAALLVPVLAAAVRRAACLATSLTSRGFDATQPRTFYPPLRFSAVERAALVVITAGTLVLTASKSLYWLAEAGIYRAASLNGLYDFARDWL